MLNRLSVNTILKSVFALLLAVIVIGLASGAWDSWRRVTSVTRIAAVADVTTYMFTALHNLRVDRSSTFRDLVADKQLTTVAEQLKVSREAEMPALKWAVIALDKVDFPERQSAVADLAARVKKLTALQEESLSAFMQPKAARRASLAQEFFDEETALLDTLDKLSSRLTRLVKLEDPYIDQLLALKQFAWVVRNAGGDASLLISNGIAGLPFPADPLLKYTPHVSKMDTAWPTVQALS